MRRDDLVVDLERPTGLQVLGQAPGQDVDVEGVHGHRRQVALRRRRLLAVADHAAGFVEHRGAEARRLLGRHPGEGDRQVGAVFEVLPDHRPVVHRVDVIAGDDQHQLGPKVADEGEVLPHRVGGAAVPVRVLGAAVGGENAQLAGAADVVPGRAAGQVGVERVRPVLGEDADRADPRVHHVRQREVDEPVHPPDRDGALRPLGGEHRQLVDTPARQHQTDG
jgi:hypothetical protein